MTLHGSISRHMYDDDFILSCSMIVSGVRLLRILRDSGHDSLVILVCDISSDQVSF